MTATALEPRAAHDRLAQDPACRLLDVREYPEWQAEHVARAVLAPLSTFNVAQLDLDRAAPLLVLCRTSNRARQAADRLRVAGYQDVAVIDGGLEAWKKAGLPYERGAARVWSLERQVRFTAGSLVLTGVIGWALLSPWFLLLSAGVGSGLMFSAVTDTCAMGMLLAKMPWNPAPKPALTPALQ